MMSPFTRSQGVLLYLAGWVPFFILYTLGMRQTAAPNFLTALGWTATYLVPGIAIGGFIWRIGTRIPWSRLSWPKFFFVEVALNLSFIGLWHLLFYGYMAIVSSVHGALDLASTTLAWQVLMAVLVSAVHSAVFHAVRIVGELRAKELAAAAAEALRVRAEMNALRGQLDPHFLFNSLHSITALVREDPRRAEDALLQFAALLRRVLDVKRDATDEVTLADEMKFVEDYFAIERLRLGDRLRVTCHLSPEALACWLPAFSVQPLAENAIRHAIAPRRDGGNVTVRASVEHGMLRVCVEDNGPGATPISLANANGVGLSVIRRRLILRHGKEAALEVVTQPGEGFRVRLSLPAQNAPLMESRS